MKLIIPSPRSEAKRIVFFPHSGSGPGPYLQWQAHLPDFELVGVEYSGRGSQFSCPLATNMEDLLKNVTDLDFGDRPIFFGHSLGALVAFETARRLETQCNNGPSQVIVSALPAPQSDQFQDRYLHEIGESDLFRLLQAFSTEMFAAVQDDPDLKEMLLEVLRSDFEILKTYEFKSAEAPLNCSLNVFRGCDDNVSLESQKMWERLSRAPSGRVFEFSGGHFYFTDKIGDVCNAIRSLA